MLCTEYFFAGGRAARVSYQDDDDDKMYDDDFQIFMLMRYHKGTTPRRVGFTTLFPNDDSSNSNA